MSDHYLVATDSVHTTAAACDHLLDSLSGDDRVTVLSAGSDRDAGDALNVATARLTGVADLTTVRAEGDPAEEVLAAADEREADVLVVGAGRGDVGSTTREVLAGASRPVVVVPTREADP